MLFVHAYVQHCLHAIYTLHHIHCSSHIPTSSHTQNHYISHETSVFFEATLTPVGVDAAACPGFTVAEEATYCVQYVVVV